MTGNANIVPDETALALPPPGGPGIVNIVERRFSNAVQQDIYLFTSAATPGQNVMRVQLFGPVGLEYDGRTSLAYSSIRASEIGRETRRELPGMRLVQSPLYLQNNYGPFSYAYGRGRGDDACFYAWQQIRSREEARTTFQNRGTIQVRLRLCEAGASEEKLLRNMYGYTIRAGFDTAGWNPYGAAPGVDPALGRTGNPIYPGGGDLQPAPARAVEKADDRPVLRQRRPTRVVEKPAPSAQATPDETIPLPTTTDMDAVVVPSPNCVAESAVATSCR
ncbi:hypothetical protein ASD31_00030 [Rhizobium sp. Root482]|nr:hypothetical protein ASD31_00030 [Rhizobium sp. Root482]